MRPSLLLPALVASVSAIDAYLQVDGCGSGGIICQNLNPNTCCSRSGSSYRSIWYRAIPSGWRIAIRGHGGGNCGPVNFSWTHTGNPDFCTSSTPGKYTGTGYSTGAKRRGVAASDECQKPNALVLRDGTMYDISEMAEDHIDELEAIVQAGGNVTAVPAHFAMYAKN